MVLIEEVDENFDVRAISERRRRRVSSIPHFSVFKGKNETAGFKQQQIPSKSPTRQKDNLTFIY